MFQSGKQCYCPYCYGSSDCCHWLVIWLNRASCFLDGCYSQPWLHSVRMGPSVIVTTVTHHTQHHFLIMISFNFSCCSVYVDLYKKLSCCCDSRSYCEQCRVGYTLWEYSVLRPVGILPSHGRHSALTGQFLLVGIQPVGILARTQATGYYCSPWHVVNLFLALMWYINWYFANLLLLTSWTSVDKHHWTGARGKIKFLHRDWSYKQPETSFRIYWSRWCYSYGAPYK